MADFIKKICMIGPEGVGKTSMVRRYVDNSFDEEYISTIGVSLSNKLIKVENRFDLELVLWDLEGFTNNNLHFPLSYLEGASGFVFVCDILDQNTMESTQKICQSIYSKLTITNKSCFSLALNKADLVSSEKEINEQIELARSIFKVTPPNQIYATSAKASMNVDKVFKGLGIHLVDADTSSFRSF